MVIIQNSEYTINQIREFQETPDLNLQNAIEGFTAHSVYYSLTYEINCDG